MNIIILQTFLFTYITHMYTHKHRYAHTYIHSIVIFHICMSLFESTLLSFANIYIYIHT